ncbi:Bifunctional inhibitor/plant lipid transfer protein/seed storage helical domain [Arabidopsis thaliana x Arabidopsis arenosa]|uniref:Bifunctional inhibitor/plant lipid transfer protein/seed storage helical domain n=1 Tax=Arabidopsis thaliana x Arabidopsis arenosa TaxID=1240361 RepID=A0A8T1XM84_9BRAS|nr:Bifunctional inhibitor/plant lipid transfer protein/seed storage helical domain [Arabidopsis thaliana x Arabidopsis arenosa]
MASKKVTIAMIVMIVVVMAMLVDRSVAIDLCGMTQDELNECKPAVSKENPTSPSQPCCTALQHADFTCLCGYKNSPWLGSFGVDPELASSLPKQCGLANAPTC